MNAPTSPDSLVARLCAIVGERYVLTAAADVEGYITERRHHFSSATRAVVRPGSTAEVAAVMKLAHEIGTPVVPQGGNTGLVGGNVPDDSGRAIVLSLTRLDRVRAVDTANDSAIVEAGVTLAKLQAVAEENDRLFPLSLASEGSCTIGGNLASNAGGTAVLAYGNTRDLVLGLEVVLADGRVWHGLRTLRKDNTGYDLRHLFIGSEGTLGVITAASVKLYPRPRATGTAFIGIADPAAALAILKRAKAAAGSSVTTIELIPRFGVEIVTRHAPGARDPFGEPYPWYVLLELTSPVDTGLAETLNKILEQVLEEGEALDAVVAASLEQRKAFWKLREELSDLQGREGGSIKHDVSVPLTALPEMIAEASAAVQAMVPGARPVPFGHVGDGNIHFNVTQPAGADQAAFLARWEEMNAVVHAIVTRLGGSISAEHGIGRLKQTLLPGVKDPVEYQLMQAVKAMLDPAGILNPGVILPAAE